MGIYLANLLSQDLNPDCSECDCAWCGESNGLTSCKSCKMLFCNNCIKKNLGTTFLSEVLATGWHCCCCHPNLLQRLSSQLEKAKGSVETSDSSSSSDSDDSHADINVTIRCIYPTMSLFLRALILNVNSS